MTSRFSSSSPRRHASATRAAVLGVLAAVGLVAWSGCGPGDESRYYCDADGCYQCDAYGCSGVSTPDHQACTGNASGAPGSQCTTTGCATICTSDASCPKGEVCKGGVCAAPSKDPGTKKECTTKGDCGGGKACVDGACEACGGSAGPCPCSPESAASDCDAGQACVAGKCTAPENGCKFSSECGGDKVCADGQCLTSCASAPCSDGFTCDKGVCKPTPAGGGCTADTACPLEAPKCVGGTCTKTCSGDPECGAGNYCDQGACVVDTRPKPNCTTDDQCGGTAGTPKKCLGGYCKYTCTTDQYCRTIDNRIGFCAKDGVCRTESEAHAACTQPTDCTAPASCIDNQCK
jgi:hypothetical protein